jgi:hypothetical protein
MAIEASDSEDLRTAECDGTVAIKGLFRSLSSPFLSALYIIFEFKNISVHPLTFRGFGVLGFWGFGRGGGV